MTADNDANVAVHPTALKVRKEVTVEAPLEHAFGVFTDGIDTWWVREHHAGPGELKRVVLEPREGGRCYNVETDGNEVDWGKVLAWEPPGRLVLGWQLTAEWQYDPEFLTEVEVTFTATEGGATLVVLEHRNLDRYAEAAQEVHAALDSDGGWGGSMASFAKAASEGV
jgi:uncharacterized protein YndB with AHSA1/START domain